MLGGFSHPSEEIRDGKRGETRVAQQRREPAFGREQKDDANTGNARHFRGRGARTATAATVQKKAKGAVDFSDTNKPRIFGRGPNWEEKSAPISGFTTPGFSTPPFSRGSPISRGHSRQTVRSWACPVLTGLPLPFATQSHSHSFYSRDRSGKLCGGAGRRRRPGSSAAKRLRLFPSPGQDAARTSSTPSRPHASISPSIALMQLLVRGGGVKTDFPPSSLASTPQRHLSASKRRRQS